MNANKHEEVNKSLEETGEKAKTETPEAAQAGENSVSENDKPENGSAQEMPEPEFDYSLETSEEEEPDEEVDENTVSDDGTTLPTIEEVVESMRNLLKSETFQRKETDDVKNQFYRLLRNETEAQKEIFLADGGDVIDFVAAESEIFAEGKNLIQKIKDKRAEILARENAEKEKNVSRKLIIIEQVKNLIENQSQEDFNKSYQEFRALQQQWNEIKLVPQTKVNELWKEYQRYVERFYDLVRINNEFREYDFKKNLELKTELINAAERLENELDVVSAFHQLQNLHQEWREIGPVSRKEREEIWNRFKEVSTRINRRYQAHFESLKGREEENLALKTALCEKLEAIDYGSLKTIKDWTAKIKEVVEIQEQWRKIGFAPKKMNTKIYERYRAACDFFFRHKNEFYKAANTEMEGNMKKKTALCERAEALKESTDWRKTGQEMIDLQKEWKSIGIVPRKYADALWKRFIDACDYFFEQKKLSSSSKLDIEMKNLAKKNEIVRKIEELDRSLGREEMLSALKELMAEWAEAGHVPFKFKDKTYRDFHEATEAQYDYLKLDKSERRLDSYKSTVSDLAKSDNAKGNLLRERDRLMRQYERMKNEVQTYENNLGFLSVSSKKGNSLLDEMNRKINELKIELELIVKKIETIDKELQ